MLRIKDHVDDAARASECADHFVSQISRNVGIARHAECVATTGAVEVLTMSQNVGSETCETSTIIPNRFISRTTLLPNSFSPRVRPTSSPDDPAQLVLTLQAGDMYRTPMYHSNCTFSSRSSIA